MKLAKSKVKMILLHMSDPKLVSRRDKVFSQALISVITAFSSQLRCALDGVFNNMKVFNIVTY